MFHTICVGRVCLRVSALSHCVVFFERSGQTGARIVTVRRVPFLWVSQSQHTMQQPAAGLSSCCCRSQPILFCNAHRWCVKPSCQRRWHPFSPQQHQQQPEQRITIIIIMLMVGPQAATKPLHEIYIIRFRRHTTRQRHSVRQQQLQQEASSAVGIDVCPSHTASTTAAPAAAPTPRAHKRHAYVSIYSPGKYLTGDKYE